MAIDDEIIITSIVALLGGGLLGGLASIWKAKQEAKKSPIDITSVTIGSAERALIMLKTLLDEAEKDIIELRAENKAKDEKIRELEESLRHLEQMFNEVSEKLVRVLKTAEEARTNGRHQDQS